MAEYQIVRAPYWSKKKYFIRKRRRYDRPSKNELMNRLRFATVSTKLYGSKGLADNGLPIVADKTGKTMKSLPPIGRKREVLSDRDVRALQNEMVRKGIDTVYLPDKYTTRRQLP